MKKCTLAVVGSLLMSSAHSYPAASPSAKESPEPEPTETPAELTPEVPAQKEEDPVALPSDSALQPFNTAWIYPTVLNARPGDGMASDVNPPRMSWPYLKDTLPEEEAFYNSKLLPPTVFTLQISKTPDFASPEIEIVDTPYNFYNALPVLEDREWFWRVGYGAAPDQVWTEPMRFTFTGDAVEWDRSLINRAHKIIGQKSGSLTGPADGDWLAWGERLKNNPDTAAAYEQLERQALDARMNRWWINFPQTDVIKGAPQSRAEMLKHIYMLKACVNAAFWYRLTGDEKYRPALDHVVEMASWPRGGLLSPEGHFGGFTKMPSQAAELFAAFYDWFKFDLSDEDRETVKEAIRWRLQDMYFDTYSIIWQQGDESMTQMGLVYSVGSHPYQNFTWTVPAALLMAGELEIADQLLVLMLNYLTGVTIPEGPEEGYNEGHGYSSEKSGTMLKAVLTADLLLPELEIGKNPMLGRLAEWFAFMFPGAERLPWGDSHLKTAAGGAEGNLRMLTYLTDSPLARRMWEERAGGDLDFFGSNSSFSAGLYARPWFELMAYERYAQKAKDMREADPEKVLFLPEAGWVFAYSRPIASMEDYQQAIGMQFQMRPRGGYGHSYASDGSFVWFAYGKLLTVGGGWRTMTSPYAHMPMSHNSLLIDGKGHDRINQYYPNREYTARPLTFEEGDGYVYWSAELTEGYRHLTDVERVHRHVLFLQDKWFLIYDDLAVKETAEPVRFSWLYKVYQPSPMKLLQDRVAGFQYQIDDVKAQVLFANDPASLVIQNAEGKDSLKNMVTGEDMTEKELKRVGSMAETKKKLKEPFHAHNLWVSNAEPSREFHFLSVLAAASGEEPLPAITFENEKLVKITTPDGKVTRVSFDPAMPADINIDIDKVREHARQTALE